MKKMMMKSFCAALSLLAFAACSDNDDVNNGGNPGDNGNNNGPLATVNFELSTDAASSGTLTKALPAPVYGKEGFRILAFKQDETGATEDYIYAQDVDPETLTYDASAQKLSGQVQLPIGTYKFISMYGLPASSILAMPELSGAVLGPDLLMTHASNQVLPSVFLDVNELTAVPSYDLGLESPGTNETVTSSINRAVGRVDLLILRAPTGTTPVAGDDVFGPSGIKNITLNFGDAKNTMDLTGHITDGAMGHTYIMDFPANAAAITMGSNDTEMTLGTEGYVTYDNVDPDHIIRGSAHVSGAYLIPESDDTPATTLSMTFTPNSGTPRTINITPAIPLKRNYVTLITVYVRGDNVFTTGVDFAVTIDPTWAGSQKAEVEVK